MKWFKKDKRELYDLPLGANPKTYSAVVHGFGVSFMQKREREAKVLEDYGRAYEQGGMVTQAINSYALFALTNGYRLEGDDENLVKYVQDWLDTFDFIGCMRQAVVDSLVFKYAFQEKIMYNDGGIHSMKPAPSELFDIIQDDYGKLVEIRQYRSTGDFGFGEHLKFSMKDLFVFEWQWVMHSAWDDIMRDARTIDGITTSIERHGFPRYHIKIGQEGETVSKDSLSAVGKQFEGLKPNMEMATVRDVDILNLDSGGVTQAIPYNTVTVQRVTSAIGVPEEILGLGRGSTEATANVRLQTFYDTISALQQALSRAYNRQVIDEKTGRPGAVKLVFNDVSPIDEKMNMEVALMMVQANGIDPEYFFTRTEIRQRAGFDAPHPDEEGDVE